MNGRCAECWRYRQVSATRHQQHHEGEARTGYPSIHGSTSQCHFWSSNPWGSKLAIGQLYFVAKWMVQQPQPSIFARINILKFLPYKRVSLITPFVIKVLKWIILEHHVLKCIWNGLTQSNLPIVLLYWVGYWIVFSHRYGLSSFFQTNIQDGTLRSFPVSHETIRYKVWH